MGKEVLTGLIEENAKRGFEAARECGAASSNAGLLEEIGFQLARECAALKPGGAPVTVRVALETVSEQVTA